VITEQEKTEKNIEDIADTFAQNLEEGREKLYRFLNLTEKLDIAQISKTLKHLQTVIEQYLENETLDEEAEENLNSIYVELYTITDAADAALLQAEEPCEKESFEKLVELRNEMLTQYRLAFVFGHWEEQNQTLQLQKLLHKIESYSRQEQKQAPFVEKGLYTHKQLHYLFVEQVYTETEEATSKSVEVVVWKGNSRATDQNHIDINMQTVYRTQGKQHVAKIAILPNIVWQSIKETLQLRGEAELVNYSILDLDRNLLETAMKLYSETENLTFQTCLEAAVKL